MTNLPFHDGRSFAMYLKSEAKKKGISMYKLFEMGVIDKKLFRRYEMNKRDPKVSTAAGILERLAI